MKEQYYWFVEFIKDNKVVDNFGAFNTKLGAFSHIEKFIKDKEKYYTFKGIDHQLVLKEYHKFKEEYLNTPGSTPKIYINEDESLGYYTITYNIGIDTGSGIAKINYITKKGY